ncbi:MAG: hypothetical protein SH859_09450 [Hyphomicrobium aestuarii]|nr:hypothetical protein [Hyphomicrobium aestuarii]
MWGKVRGARRGALTGLSGVSGSAALADDGVSIITWWNNGSKLAVSAMTRR